MSSSSSAPLVGAAAVVAAIAGSQILEPLQEALNAILEMSLVEQFCVMALILAVLLGAVAATAADASSVTSVITKPAVALSSSSTKATTATKSKGLTVMHNQAGRRSTTKTYPTAQMAACDSDVAKFKCLFPMLRDEMLAHMREHNEMADEAVNWVQDMLDYNVPGGKLNRGTTVMSVYRALLAGQRDVTETELARAAVLGWAIEFLQAFFLVADDVMDDSQTRRGQPCWYKSPKVKLIAINDSFLLESFVFAILREHFQDDDFYAELLELFLDVTQKTEFGQLLDLTSQPMDAGTKGGPKIDLNRFTIERYKSIVKYKTAFYSFYLPVAVGLLLSGKYTEDSKAYDTAREILMIMGEYFQVQDDYLDCFGDPQVIGKVGTDIQDNKCSWLVVQALAKCNAAQRKVLEQNYGTWNDKKVSKVKALYEELELPKLFQQYEEESYNAIQKMLDSVTIPRDVFELFLKKIYKRTK